MTTTERGGKGKKNSKKKNPKNLDKNIEQAKHKNNKCFSWVTAFRVLSLAGSHSPPHLPRMPSKTVLVSEPAVGQVRF